MPQEFDSIGRRVLGEGASRVLAFNRLLLATHTSDDWDGPLGSAAELALNLGSAHDSETLTLSVVIRNEILAAREISEDAVREVYEDFGLPYHG